MKFWWRISAKPAVPATAGPDPGPRDALHAIHEERARIYRDLHDDIGARLVSILSASSEERIRELARDALHDLREVVYHARGEPGTLDQVLGEIRAELANRLDMAGWRMDWQQECLPEALLPGDCTIHLYRILREATTNAIKYAAPGTLRIRVRAQDGMVYLDITDQGGPEGAHVAGGSGQQGMRDRAERIGGQLQIEPGTLCGTKVVLRFPLPSAGTAPH